jgi:hypothetical protein
MGSGWMKFALSVMTALGLLVAGAVWQNASLQSAFQRGEAAGRSAAEAAIREAATQQARAAQAALTASRAEAARMERSHALLQRKLEELIDDVDAAAAGQGGAARKCLAPGVVRRLDAIGRHGGASADGSRGADPPLHPAR